MSVGCAVYSASRWLWSSLLSWILVRLQLQEFKGIALILAAQWNSALTNMGFDEFDKAPAVPLTAAKLPGGDKKKRCAKVLQTEMSVGLLLLIKSKYVFLVGETALHFAGSGSLHVRVLRRSFETPDVSAGTASTPL